MNNFLNFKNVVKITTLMGAWYIYHYRHKIVQNNFLAYYVRDYFPIKLIKTADLPKGSNYLLASFPHGSLPISIFMNFFRNSNEIDKIFPGIDMRAALHGLLLYVPFLREILIMFGKFTIYLSHCVNL